MGDRANVVILQRPQQDQELGGIYLYTHWGGSDLPIVLRNALARGLRWTDEQYLARIIFCEMVRGLESEETGFGISNYLADNDRPLIEVDANAQTVRIGKTTWTFEDYAKAKNQAILKVYEREEAVPHPVFQGRGGLET